MYESMENHEDAARVISRWLQRIPRRINPRDAFTLERRITPPWFLLHPSSQRCFVFNADDLYRHVVQSQATNPFTGAPLLSVEMTRLARASSFTGADDDRSEPLRPLDALDDVMNSAFELSAADFSINVDHILRIIGETPLSEEEFFMHLSTLFLVSQSSLANFPPSRVSRLFETHLFQLNRIENASWVDRSYLHLLYNSIVSIARGIPVNLNQLAIHPRRPPQAPSRQPSRLLSSRILRTFRPASPFGQRSFQPRSAEDFDRGADVSSQPPSYNDPLILNDEDLPRINEGPNELPDLNEGPHAPPDLNEGPNEPPSLNEDSDEPPSLNEVPDEPPNLNESRDEPPSLNEGPDEPPSLDEDPDEPPSLDEGTDEPPSLNEDPDEPPSLNENSIDDLPNLNGDSLPIPNDEPPEYPEYHPTPSDEALSSGEHSHVDDNSTGTNENEGLPSANERGPRDDEDDDYSSSVASGIHFYTLRELRELQASNTDEILRLRNLRDLRSVLIRRRARRFMNDAFPR